MVSTRADSSTAVLKAKQSGVGLPRESLPAPSLYSPSADTITLRARQRYLADKLKQHITHRHQKLPPRWESTSRHHSVIRSPAGVHPRPAAHPALRSCCRRCPLSCHHHLTPSTPSSNQHASLTSSRSSTRRVRPPRDERRRPRIERGDSRTSVDYRMYVLTGFLELYSF